MPTEEVRAKGLVERIGQPSGRISYEAGPYRTSETLPVPDHAFALQQVARHLMNRDTGVIRQPGEIAIIAHRVVHGGESFSDTVIIDREVKEKIRSLFSLAPLHNPPNLKGIEVAEELFPDTRQIAVFDTAFHQTIPQKASRYAIPPEFYTKHHIKVYGFHGTSHHYVSKKAGEFLERKDTRLISVHLGNGCSITAIRNGKSVDHSLGFGPVNGLVMGTRSGDIDQAVIFYLIEQLGYSAEEVSDLLHHKSGMLGLTGYSDLRDIEAGAAKHDPDCLLALELSTYRIKKYIGAYAAGMNGLDALIFTAGIGENSSLIRSMVCQDMDYLGIEISQDRNQEKSSSTRLISTDSSRVRVLVIPTDEELEIAQQAYALGSEI